MDKKKKILVILGRGGHTEQLSRLLTKLGDKFEYEYVIGTEDTTSKSKIHVPGKTYHVLNPRLMTDINLTKVALKMVPASFQALKILLNTKAQIILTAGPSLAIPFFALARLMRKKTIFIESWVRVKNKSLTGKLLYPLSDLFIVQWPAMKKQYPRAVYGGRLS